MRRKAVFAGIFVLAVTVFGLKAQERSRASSPDIEPEAIAALNKMGGYLRTIKVSQIRAETSREEVLVDGQKILFSNVTELLAQSPNHLRVQTNSDREDRLYLYD